MTKSPPKHKIMKNKEGSNIVYASKQDLNDAGYIMTSKQCKPGDLLLAADGDEMLLLQMSAATIRASGVNANAHAVFRKKE